MSDTEFGEQAAEIAARITRLPADQRIAAACRGSGNPAALAWLAENLRLCERSLVVDLGAGLGGPSAWLRSRYRCNVIAVEPEEQTARAVSSIFAVPAVVAQAQRSPFLHGTFDAALVLGVVSVVPDPLQLLAEAHRVSRALGLLDYCSTGDDTVAAGGSSFPTETHLRDMVGARWQIDQCAAVAVEAPFRWTHANQSAHSVSDPDENEVVRAIEAGRIAPIMVVASR